MDAVQICLAVASFCGGLLFVSVSDTVSSPCKQKSIGLVTILACLAAAYIVGQSVSGGQAFDQVFMQLLLEGKPKALLTVLAGCVAGLCWGLLTIVAQKARGLTAISMLATVCVVTTALLLAWDDEFDIERFQPSVLDDNYTIVELAKLDQVPTRLALCDTDDTLFVSTYSTENNGVYGGTVFSLPLRSADLPLPPTIAASSAALYRPFGMACYDGDLYISRAGHGASAANGKVDYANLGAVTQLKDLDDDGQFEFMHDVIQGIPAARGPDTMHQNNGIAFDSDGNLYVAVGSADDRSLDQHPWPGSILELAPGGTEPEVFARGFRNPFGICCGPQRSLFVTDNDCADDPGDEVNFVIEGDHCGHPFAIPGESGVAGFTTPLIFDLYTNYGGIAFVPQSNLQTEHGYVFVCDIAMNAINRLTVSVRDGQCTVLDHEVFARVQFPVDIVASRTGELYVLSYTKQKVYRISPR